MSVETRQRRWAWARPVVGVAILAVLVWRVGTRPFLDAVRLVDGRSLAAVAVITALTTACCAWRWRLVAGGLGMRLPLRTAVAAYYRSQLLNTTLPGGVLGDVHRGVLHGRQVGDTGRALRAVACERLSGQAVQLALAVVVLLVLPSPVRSSMPVVTLVIAVVAVLAAVAVLVVVVAVALAGTTAVAASRLNRRTWAGVLVASALAVAGHTTAFVVAARAAGSTASTARLLPLALLVLLAMGLPTNVAGWGPREGVAAWAFGAAGLGAAQGVTTAAIYGVLVLVACLPGAAVLVAGRLPRRNASASSVETVVRVPEVVALEGFGRG